MDLTFAMWQGSPFNRSEKQNKKRKRKAIHKQASRIVR